MHTLTCSSYVNAAGTPLALFTATYDRVGNRLTVVELDGSTDIYSYDAINQLVSEGSLSYIYDPVGNRLRKNYGPGDYVTYTYNAANEILQEFRIDVPYISYQYDNNGNRLAEFIGTGATTPSTTFLYDGENHYIGYTQVGNSVNMKVDADGHRQSITDQSGTSYLIWDDENIVNRLNSSLVTDMEFTQYPGELGGLISMRSNGADSYYVFDMSGNTRLLVSSAGSITDSWQYHAFGEQTGKTGTTYNPFTYVGQYNVFDVMQNIDISAQYNMGLRMFASKEGVFLSRDPIGFDGGDWNLYRYVRNNPVNRVDPSGLNPWNPNDTDFGVFRGVDVLRPTGNFVAGFGDTYASWITKPLRKYYSEYYGWGDANYSVDPCATSYTAGRYAAYIHMIVSSFAGSFYSGPFAKFWSGGNAAISPIPIDSIHHEANDDQTPKIHR